MLRGQGLWALTAAIGPLAMVHRLLVAREGCITVVVSHRLGLAATADSGGTCRANYAWAASREGKRAPGAE